MRNSTYREEDCHRNGEERAGEGMEPFLMSAASGGHVEHSRWSSELSNEPTFLLPFKSFARSMTMFLRAYGADFGVDFLKSRHF